MGVWVTPVYAAAVHASFGVSTRVGSDTIPPSTPLLRDVVPVSTSRINVTWDVATDNYLLSGYRLFRDGIQIATTTQTSFTDTGLAASTTYAYTVEAFDSSLNISSTSPSMATTTFAVPDTPPVVPVGTTTNTHKTSSTMLLVLQSFSLTPTERAAEIKWQTNINVRYVISWGRTTSYELGTVSTSLFKQAHVTTLENLEPGTRYWYQVQVEDTAGVMQVMKTGEFATIPAFQSVAPTNVRNITVAVTDTDVRLDWVNPELSPGSKVRVVRNYLFYPFSTTDGALVYEGDGTSVIDTSALQEHPFQYYTIFVIDAAGAVSSGAVVVASRVPGIPSASSSTIPTSPTSTVASSSVTVPDSILDESGDVAVLHADAVFIRQGLVVQHFSNGMKLDADIPYTVYIPVVAVVTHLKSILVSIKDPTDQRIVTTYLLKLNKNGDAYAADIESPHVIGVAGMTVEVFDFTQASVRRLTAPIIFVASQNATRMFPDNVVEFARTYGDITAEALGAIVLCLWFILWRRRREDNN